MILTRLRLSFAVISLSLFGVSSLAAAQSTTTVPVTTQTAAPEALPTLLPQASTNASATPQSSTLPSPAASATPTVPEASPTPIAIPPRTRLHLHAGKISYDADRFILVARDGVSLTTDTGYTLTARYFSMDVKANRYLLAGHVQVLGPETKLEGAALSNFLEFGRIYFLPSETTPDRVTYLDGQFKTAEEGREMPGDAFALPENISRHPTLVAKDVVITPNATLRFAFAQLNTGVVTVPVPSYVLNLSQNPNFAQNSLAGASFDASYPFAGSKRSSTAFHIRAGGGNGVFGAIEQRLVWDKSYLVGSISPLNHSLKQYNVLGSKTITPTLQVQGFAQEQAFQHGFSQPLNASLYLNIRATQALKHSYLQYTISQYYQSLLADPKRGNPSAPAFYGDASHVFIPNHPIDMQLSWVGFDQKVLKLPLKYRLRSGYDYNHDTFGILPDSAANPGTISYTTLQRDNWGLIGIGVPTITNSFLGGIVYTPSYRLVKDRNGFDVYFNASFDAQRRWYSLPHQVNTTNTAFSLSKTYGTRLNMYLSYTIAHIGDQYGDLQRNVYPVAPAGSIDPEFKGFSTFRTLSQGIVYTPSSNFNTSLIVAETSGFPKSIPGVFGPAPLSLTGEVRYRFSKHFLLDVTRTYYYNYGTQRFNPGFGILISG